MTNNIHLAVTTIIECDNPNTPSESFIEQCLKRAWDSLPNTLLKRDPDIAENDFSIDVTVKLIDETAITELNNTFFAKNKPTNVLSFPSEGIPGLPCLELGDIVLCPSIIAQEATDFDRSFKDRFGHMLIHGLLHLLGYDHIDEEERKTMESIEKNLLNEQGFCDPYA